MVLRLTARGVLAVFLSAGILGLGLALRRHAAGILAASGPAVVWQVETTVPAVALTFDDGPDPRYTPQVLEVLRQHGAVATFFVLGRAAEAHPDLVRAEARQGSEVCNHGWSHTLLRGRSAAFVAAEVTRTAEVLRRLGVPACRLFRFPYFASDAAARRAVADLGYTLVAAAVDPRDWARTDAAAIAAAVLTHAAPGAIILLHDAGGRRDATVAALGPILAGLARKHLRPVTVSQLLAAGPPATRAAQ